MENIVIASVERIWEMVPTPEQDNYPLSERSDFQFTKAEISSDGKTIKITISDKKKVK